MQVHVIERLSFFVPALVRRAAFRLLERFSELRTPADARALAVCAPREGGDLRGPFIWVYVATLGEFNLSAAFIDGLLDADSTVTLLLLTDRELYASAYQNKYPTAPIVITDGRTSHARELVRRFPPKALIISEIPCWPGDAPCRLGYPLVNEVKRGGAPVALINAWVYDYPASSRIVEVERALFRASYLRAMTLITAQTDNVKTQLVREGADERRVHVTGNMKFDILGAGSHGREEITDAMLRSLIESPRPCVVAGCVGKVEQQPLISAFSTLRETHRSARIIVALRHPENPEHLGNLITLLNEAGISWVRRSEHGGKVLAESCDCLILDTFGELARFYSAGKVAYVGRDHNVLEPLAHGAKVSVLSGWKAVFPSYPVYHRLRECGLLSEANDAPGLAILWDGWLSDESISARSASRLPPELRSLTGATEKNLQLVLEMLSTD